MGGLARCSLYPGEQLQLELDGDESGEQKRKTATTVAIVISIFVVLLAIVGGVFAVLMWRRRLRQKAMYTSGASRGSAVYNDLASSVAHGADARHSGCVHWM